MNNKELLRRIELAEHNKYEEIQTIQQPTDYKKLIKLITPIVLIIGATILGLIFFLQPAIEKAKENPDLSPEVAGILSVLPIMLAITAVLGAAAYIGTQGKSKEEKDKEEQEQTA